MNSKIGGWIGNSQVGVQFINHPPIFYIHTFIRFVSNTWVSPYQKEVKCFQFSFVLVNKPSGVFSKFYDSIVYTTTGNFDILRWDYIIMICFNRIMKLPKLISTIMIPIVSREWWTYLNSRFMPDTIK